MTSSPHSQEYLFANEGLFFGDDDLLAADLTEDELAAHLDEPSLENDFLLLNDPAAASVGIQVPSEFHEDDVNECLEAIDRALDESPAPSFPAHLDANLAFESASLLPDRALDEPFPLDISPERLILSSFDDGLDCVTNQRAEFTPKVEKSDPPDSPNNRANTAVDGRLTNQERKRQPASKPQRLETDQQRNLSLTPNSHKDLNSPRTPELHASPATVLTLFAEMPQDENDEEYWLNRAATIAEAAKCRHRDELKSEHREREEKASREGTPLTSLQKERSRSRRESSVTRIRAQVYVRELEAIARAVPSLQRELVQLRSLVTQLQDISETNAQAKNDIDGACRDSSNNLIHSMESLELETDQRPGLKRESERSEDDIIGATQHRSDSVESTGSWKRKLSEWVGF